MFFYNLNLHSQIFSFMIGICFGSFVNVIIYRLPLGKSIVLPSSYCINCKHKINWYDNIPLISWFFLRGKCRRCRENISFMYPLVEMIMGLLFIFSNYSMPTKFQISSFLFTTVLGWIFATILFILALLDMKYLWLPDSIVKAGIFSGILFSLIRDIIYSNSLKFLVLLEPIIAAFLGYLIFRIISKIGFLIFHKPAMGKGDAKLSALIGSWLGVKGLCITIWLSFNFAGLFVIAGLILKKLKRDQKIPFGTFLAISAIFVWHFGNSTFSNIIYLGS